MKISVNGTEYEVPDGSNISAANGVLLVNGMPHEGKETKLMIEISGGQVGRVDVRGGDVIVHGDVHELVVASGSVTCGNVNAHVEAGGSVACGNVSGYVEARGNVACGTVGRDVCAGGNVICIAAQGDIDAKGSVKVIR